MKHMAMWVSGRKRLLTDILAGEELPAVDGWWVSQLDGIGKGFRGLTQMQMEELANGPEGLAVAPDELLEFAVSLVDINEIELAGLKDGKEVLSVTAFDSTAWQIRRPTSEGGS
jgi:hypothetical protein